MSASATAAAGPARACRPQAARCVERQAVGLRAGASGTREEPIKVNATARDAHRALPPVRRRDMRFLPNPLRPRSAVDQRPLPAPCGRAGPRLGREGHPVRSAHVDGTGQRSTPSPSSSRSTAAPARSLMWSASCWPKPRFPRPAGHRYRIDEIVLVHDHGDDASDVVIRELAAAAPRRPPGVAVTELRAAPGDARRHDVDWFGLDRHDGRRRPARPEYIPIDARRRDATSSGRSCTARRATHRRTAPSQHRVPSRQGHLREGARRRRRRRVQQLPPDHGRARPERRRLLRARRLPRRRPRVDHRQGGDSARCSSARRETGRAATRRGGCCPTSGAWCSRRAHDHCGSPASSAC